MTEVLSSLKPRSSLDGSTRLETFCSECNNPVKNLPISDTCKVCHSPICVQCGCYTSSFDIYCNNHAHYATKKAKKLGKNHYYSVDSQNDFFTSKNLR